MCVMLSNCGLGDLGKKNSLKPVAHVATFSLATFAYHP